MLLLSMQAVSLIIMYFDRFLFPYVVFNISVFNIAFNAKVERTPTSNFSNINKEDL